MRTKIRYHFKYFNPSVRCEQDKRENIFYHFWWWFKEE